LGLPTYIGKEKIKEFQLQKGEGVQKVTRLEEKMLSKARKEILIKAVAQAIPLYTRACFDITKSLCDDLSSMIRHYRWSQMDKKCIGFLE
jgi:hypothetical protein